MGQAFKKTMLCNAILINAKTIIIKFIIRVYKITQNNFGSIKLILF